jgi:hypothetical protein
VYPMRDIRLATEGMRQPQHFQKLVSVGIGVGQVPRCSTNIAGPTASSRSRAGGRLDGVMVRSISSGVSAASFAATMRNASLRNNLVLRKALNNPRTPKIRRSVAAGAR